MYVDNVNPVPSALRVSRATPRPAEVARRGDLVVVLADGVTGRVVRTDFARVFPEMADGERAFVQDVFEEALEAALSGGGAAGDLLPAPVFFVALKRALRALSAAGLPSAAERLAGALVATGPGRPVSH